MGATAPHEIDALVDYVVMMFVVRCRPPLLFTRFSKLSNYHLSDSYYDFTRIIFGVMIIRSTSMGHIIKQIFNSVFGFLVVKHLLSLIVSV